ncbi:hypothetical protein [Flavonifractor plautii]|uniref:hypothetical protein n=1 Tax=Flavonifractor plautii TaxID=292800 RepID=UPI0036F1D29E
MVVDGVHVVPSARVGKPILAVYIPLRQKLGNSGFIIQDDTHPLGGLQVVELGPQFLFTLGANVFVGTTLQLDPFTVVPGFFIKIKLGASCHLESLPQV